MSGWTRGSLFAALKAAGVASILGWVLVLSAGPALADPDPAPGDPGLSRRPSLGCRLPLTRWRYQLSRARCGAGPDTVHRHGAIRAAEVRPCQRLDGGCGPADHHRLPRAGR